MAVCAWGASSLGSTFPVDDKAGRITQWQPWSSESPQSQPIQDLPQSLTQASDWILGAFPARHGSPPGGGGCLCFEGPIGLGASCHSLRIPLPPCFPFPGVRFLPVCWTFPTQSCLLPLETFTDTTPNLPFVPRSILSVCFLEDLTDSHTYIIRAQDTVDVTVIIADIIITISIISPD